MNAVESDVVPKPTDSGSDGQQESADGCQELVPAKPLAAPMADTVSGLAASNSRVFGSEATSRLIAGMATHYAAELETAKQELVELRSKSETLSENLTEEKVRSAVLAERIDSFRSTRHLKNLGIAVGSLILGNGTLQIGNGNVASGFAALIIGAVIVVTSWLSVPKGGDK